MRTKRLAYSDPPLTGFGRELGRSEVVGLPIVVLPVGSEWVSVY